jgi:hypothetical protein
MIAPDHREWLWRSLTAVCWCLATGCLILMAVEVVRAVMR